MYKAQLYFTPAAAYYNTYAAVYFDETTFVPVYNYAYPRPHLTGTGSYLSYSFMLDLSNGNFIGFIPRDTSYFVHQIRISDGVA